ncbi:MAG: septum formation initiator family protein [Flavobacteriales bacterium]
MKYRIPPIVNNRYALVLIVFFAYMLFFNDADVFSVYKSNLELDQIQEEIEWYNHETAACRDRLEKLEEGGFELERLAREKHYFQKDNEDVFIVKSSK